eukprot:590999-Pyramimonas_sp.AAC.2
MEWARRAPAVRPTKEVLRMVAVRNEPLWRLADEQENWAVDAARSIRNMLRHANQGIIKTDWGGLNPSRYT